MSCNPTSMVGCCSANIGGAPAVLAPPTLLTVPVEGTADIPTGAQCVTLTFQLCANAAAAFNQIAVKVFWSSSTAPLSQESVLQQTATCGEFDTCLAVFNSPEVSTPDCVVWDLTLSIPGGKSDVQVVATETGDPVNPGTLAVWVAFK